MGPYRSFWRATVTFGQVSIPVKMYAAVEDGEVHLRQLHRPCGSPISYRKWCPACDVEVQKADVVWAYEASPGRFVPVEPAEPEEPPDPEGHWIEVLDFVATSEVGPLFLERPYYLEPASPAVRAYRVLVEAMEKTGRVGLAHLVLRGRQRLAALYPVGGVLTLVIMRWAHQVRLPGQVVQLPEGNLPSPQERQAAIRLVRRWTVPFDPSRYVSRRPPPARTWEPRASGQGAAPTPAAPASTPPADLLQALRESLKARPSPGQHSGARTTRPGPGRPP